MNRESHYKTCSLCGTVWHSVEAFIQDEALELNGFQASFLSPDRGLFLFTHHREDCGTTLSIHAGTLKEYAPNLDLAAHSMGGPACNRSCFEESDLSSCSVNCYMRWVRDLIPLLKNKTLVTRVAS